MLIGLAGYARSGKDTVGSILKREHDFHTKAFADLMRASALALNPIVGCDTTDYGVRYVRYSELLEAIGYERAKSCAEVREFLQRLGTEMGRKVFGDNFWIERAFTDVDLEQHWAFTDVRFVNEAKAILSHHGIVVGITRPGCGPANDHISEHELDGWPFDNMIENDGTLDELALRVQGLVAWAS